MRSGDGWEYVDEEEQHVVPCLFTVRGVTGSWCMPACYSTPVTFLFLFTTGTMKTVLHNTVAYTEVVFCDMAACIVHHPNSQIERWIISDIAVKILKQYLGLCTRNGLIHKETAKDYWSRWNYTQCSACSMLDFWILLHVDKQTLPPGAKFALFLMPSPGPSRQFCPLMRVW